MQLGFKSCPGYLCKRKRKRSVNKIHQISLENKLIVHKNQRNARFMKCTITIFDTKHIIDWKSKVEQDNNIQIKQYHIHLATLFKLKISLYSHIYNFLKLVNVLSKSQVSHERRSITHKVSFKIIDYHHIMVWWNISQ
jgi:hypothetical protein